jgi:hypothetical protein
MSSTDKKVCIKEFLFEKIKEVYDRDDKVEFGRLLQKAIIPEKVDIKTIRLAGYDLDVTGTIYSGANADEVLRGWNLLVGELVPVDIYLKTFYISTLEANLKYSLENDTKVDDETYISNIRAPVALELLSLSYWIHKCKEELDQASFATKFAEVKEHLTFRDIEVFRENLHRMLRTHGRVMGDESALPQEREHAERELMQEIETGGPFRSNVSSYVPEFMLAYLIKETGFGVKFMPATNDKKCDLVVNTFKMEVKTFLDRIDPRFKLEGSLKKEIRETLRRDKAVRDIKDALSKKSDVILIFLTFTTLGLAFPKYTYKRVVNFSLQTALRESLLLIEYNRTTKHVEKVPVITFTTAIDVTDCVYKLFFYTVPYPVKKVNDKLEPDKDKLKIDLNI